MDDLPVPLHIDHCPATGAGFVQCLVEASDMSLAVVRRFALAIGVMDDKS
jgi:hypothetical protein